jgi:teichuronic acid biosynthesis glycosyltransferase TuaC
MVSLKKELYGTNKSLRVLMVTGIYPTEELPHKGTYIKSQIVSLIAEGVEVEVLHPKPGSVWFRYPWTIMQIFLKTRTEHFDIVHGHYGQWCLFARLQRRIPVVASFLGSDLLGTKSKPKKLNNQVVWMSRWLCDHVDAVIVKSEQMKRIAGKNRIFVIPNGVDFALFHPIPRAEARHALGWDQERKYVLFGNNPAIPLKNFKLARAAIECLNARGVPAELVVAHGLPQTKVVQYINASNALILPSLSEGSPNIVKETMACNVPVVATDVGDVAEVIGRTEGCSVCPYDAEALATGLERALQRSDPTTGRTDIAHLECSCVAKQVIAVYEQVLNTSSNGKKDTSSVKEEAYEKSL